MTEGYIAVVLPKLQDVDEVLSGLMTEEQYRLSLSQTSESTIKGKRDVSNSAEKGPV